MSNTPVKCLKKRVSERTPYAYEKHLEIVNEFDKVNKMFGDHAPFVSTTHKCDIVAEKFNMSLRQVQKIIRTKKIYGRY